RKPLRRAVPGMLARRYGRVVNVASITGKEGNPTLGPYPASKAALIALTRSLARELAGRGDLTVNAVAPAVIATPILDGVPREKGVLPHRAHHLLRLAPRHARVVATWRFAGRQVRSEVFVRRS